MYDFRALNGEPNPPYSHTGIPDPAPVVPVGLDLVAGESDML